MLLIDKRVTDLVTGFARIRRADSALKNRWRGRLLAAYQERRDAYDARRLAHRQRLRALKPKMLVMLVLAAVLAILGLSVCWFSRGDLFCSGCGLFVIASITGVVVSIIWLWKSFVSRPRPPEHPLREPLKSKLLPRLLPRWLGALQGQLPAKMPYEGAQGEYEFVGRLQQLGSGNGYLVYRLQQNYGDDIDVAVIGPKGIWAFEVKYWSGTIIWRNGRWERENYHYEPGGRLVCEPREVRQDPDKQWQRMANDIAQTLAFHAPALLRRFPDLARIRGGIVFTHPDATYDIERNPPFRWGKIAGWASELRDTQPIPGVDEQTVFQVIDTLLDRHRVVNSIHNVYSMDARAQALIRDAERRIAEWIQGKR